MAHRLNLGRHYLHTGYPDLAAGEAYLSLLLLDEIEDESAEWHEQAVHAATKDLRSLSEHHDERRSDCERQPEERDTPWEDDDNGLSNKARIIGIWARDT